MDILYIVMPAYNEEAVIEKTIKEWYPIIEDKCDESRLVIADSGSRDSTHEILERLKEVFPKLIVLSDTQKEHGPKVMALYSFSIQNGADFIFQTDSDGQTNPDEFCSFWNLRNEKDAVIGVRTVRGDGISRKLVENILCVLLGIYFGIRIKDANAPYRLMKAEILKKYIQRLPENYNLPNVMLTTYFTYYKENIEFKEISFGARQSGKNSINFRKIIKTGWKSLQEFYMFRKNMNKVNAKSVK